MKRIVMLATLLAFVLGMAATASAADLVASGSWKIAATWMDNYDFIDSDNAGTDDSQSEDDLSIAQRVRTSFAFVANENLRGVLQVEIGTSEWGAPGAGADLGADDVAIEVKHAYVNFVWPNTDVSIFAGVMPVALPGGPGGNPVFDSDVAAAVISTPILDNVSLLAGYARLVADQAVVSGNDESAATDNFLDAAFIAVPMDFDGVALTPYAAFVYSGGDFLLDEGPANWEADYGGLMTQNMTAQDADATGINITYFGLTFDVSLLDPFNLSGAFHYGAMHGPWENTDRSGWLGEIQLTYTGWDFVTPALYFAYSTGEDGNSTGGNTASDEAGAASERLPTVRESYAVGSFWFGGDWLDAEVIDTGSQEMGFWTVGLFLTDISFVEGLTHEINVLYVQGTNDKSIGTQYSTAGNNPQAYGADYGNVLTEEDSLWEFDLNTKYQIYDELSAVVRLGYIDMDLDDSVWAEINQSEDSDEDAAHLLIGIEYSF